MGRRPTRARSPARDDARRSLSRVNEYTRREEVKWILLSAVTLVGCVVGALFALLTAQGPLVPDPTAKEALATATDRAKDVATCTVTSAKLVKELGVFRNYAAAAKLKDAPPEELPPDPKTPAPRTPKRPDPRHPEPKKPKKEDDSGFAWMGAAPSYQHAIALAPCRALADEAGGLTPKAEQGWKAIQTVSAIKPPAESDKTAQVIAAKQVYAALGDAPIEDMSAELANASKLFVERVHDAEEKAASATIRSPLPRGLLGREVALGAGVLISLLALLISFFSLRATSIRRATALVGLRALAHTPQRGLQAASILKLASEPNGGEPGIVIGAAVGGLAASFAMRVDADWFVVGVMGGLVLGLLVQVATRMTGSEGRFRERAMELSDVEKPTVPVVLVLSSIRGGQETEFLDAFLRLSAPEAAQAVEKLAVEAEERILVAADAQAMR